MKKIYYAIAIVLLFASCQTSYLLNFKTGLHFISSCYSNVKIISAPTIEIGKSKEIQKDRTDTYAPLPAYAWDTKMIIW
jgi:hypothetical protein